ncbi:MULTISPECIES: hypothetical protein [unclassified Moorena]|nr:MULTISPECIES: hypothetical protein [unclassified Moorena]NEP33894.1 hypothetical protein [Moorena sp. SIO3B2]NEQ12558.1 hypothetical protein [Moorena sp. SIO3E2]NES44348.1 hypothetical protein [Moorena sp. SIO2C4]
MPSDAKDRKLSAISYQLSAISYQLSAISYQLSVYGRLGKLHPIAFE